jgi:hypothetical protein
MEKYFRMAYRIPRWGVKRREKSAAYAEPRVRPQAALPRIRGKQLGQSSKPATRSHCLAATRKLTNRRLHGVFGAKQGDSTQTDRTTDSESWRIPKCRHYVTGPSGVGKSYLACALAHKACRDGYSALYTRVAALFRYLALTRRIKARAAIPRKIRSNDRGSGVSARKAAEYRWSAIPKPSPLSSTT